MKIFLSSLFIGFFGSLLWFSLVDAQSLSQKLSGRILLQVEQNGEAWYIYPKDQKRYYMGRPTDAFNLMRSFGVGITNKDLEKIPLSTSKDTDTSFSSQYKGTIFLQVEENGEAWYVYPEDAKRSYLGRPDDAFNIMRSLGLGITDKDLQSISLGATSVTPPTKSSSSTSLSLEGGDVVYFGDEKLTRPEFCIKNNRAYLTMRHAGQGASTGRTANEIAFKVFDIETNGAWKDITASLFGTDLYALYPSSNPDGYMTDPQFVCTSSGLVLAFEASEGTKKYLMVYRLDDNAKLLTKTKLFEQENDMLKQIYKSDDPGLAYLNNTIWTWMVNIDSGRIATGFSLYGLDPDTLAITSKGTNNSPLVLENPKQAPFPGVMDFFGGEYRIFTSPRDPLGTTFSSDGLIDYRYDTNWEYRGANEIQDPFGDSIPLYTTGRLHTDEFEIWGFTVQPEERRTTPQNFKKTASVNQYTNVGNAYVRLVDASSKETYIDISQGDTLGKPDDTRHTEFAITGNMLYIGYQYLTGEATIIKKYIIKNL